MGENAAAKEGLHFADDVVWQLRAAIVCLAPGVPSLPFASYHLAKERALRLVVFIGYPVHERIVPADLG